MVNASKGPADALKSAFFEIQRVMGWSNVALAARLGISTKQLARYHYGEMFPPPGRRLGMVHALKDVPREQLLPFVRALGLPDEVAPLPVPVVPLANEAVTQTVVSAAVLEAAEHLESGPGRTRLALVHFLDRLGDAHVSLASARDALLAQQAESVAKKRAKR